MFAMIQNSTMRWMTKYFMASKNILTPFKKFTAFDAETFKAGSYCFLRIICLPYFWFDRIRNYLMIF